MNSQVCIDASLVLKLVLNEADSAKADSLWHSWVTNQVEVIAPPLITIEATSVLRLSVFRGTITVPESFTALQTILSLQVRIRTFSDIHRSALDLANTLNQPRAYDTQYLALALHRKCDYWTADERFYNSARNHYPRINWLGGLS